jgi:hypothetical protein
MLHTTYGVAMSDDTMTSGINAVPVGLGLSQGDWESMSSREKAGFISRNAVRMTDSLAQEVKRLCGSADLPNGRQIPEDVTFRVGYVDLKPRYEFIECTSVVMVMQAKQRTSGQQIPLYWVVRTLLSGEVWAIPKVRAKVYSGEIWNVFSKDSVVRPTLIGKVEIKQMLPSCVLAVICGESLEHDRYGTPAEADQHRDLLKNTIAESM